MNKDEFLKAVKGRPTPFTTPGGSVVDLRPITLPERLDLFAWYESAKDEPKFGQKVRERYFALGVCNADGDRLFEFDDVAALGVPGTDFDAIADEVSRRAGIGGAKGDDPGKDLPATDS